MIKRITLIAAILLVIMIALIPAAGPATAQGQGQITVSNSAAQMNFPLSLNFSAQVKSNTNLSDIRLRYKVEQMSFAQVTSEGYVTFTPSSTVNATYTLDMLKVGGLPPGTYLDYWWVARDSNGASLETKPTQFQINDNRYKWQNLSQGKINLYWYQGNSTFANTLMSTAQQALVQLANNTGATPDKTVNIYIYASSQDLKGSMIFPNEWTGGVAFTQYNNIAIGISPSNLTWGQGAMTHELTHIVINQVVFNPYNDLPVWLNEGLAMYNEGPLDSQFTGPLTSAITKNTLISVRSLSSPFSAFPDKANLSYAESDTFVDYLVSQYGSNKMLALLNTFKQGSTTDDALRGVYGFNMDGLNSQWLTWVKTKYGK
jgi:hypothetical protein